MKIIDSHTHVFSEKIRINRNLFFYDENFKAVYDFQKSKICTGDTLLEEMEISKINSSFVYSFPWIFSEPCIEQNEYILHLSQNQNKLIPFGMIAFEEKDVKAKVSEAGRRGFFGIGEIAFYSNGFREDSAKYLNDVFYASEQEGLIVSLHVNEPVGHDYSGKYSTDFAELTSLIRKYPDLKIILAHMGGGILFYEMMPEIKSIFRNVWYDTAAVPYLYDKKIYSIAENIVGSEKILYGSDFPLLGKNRYESDMSDLSDVLKNNILYNNAVRLLDQKKAESKNLFLYL